MFSLVADGRAMIPNASESEQYRCRHSLFQTRRMTASHFCRNDASSSRPVFQVTSGVEC